MIILKQISCLFFTILLLFGFAKIYGQPVPIGVDAMTALDGISGFEVKKVFLDGEDRLWLQTDVALNVHDGNENFVFKKGQGKYNVHSLKSIAYFVDRKQYVELYYKNEFTFFDRWDKNTHQIDSIPAVPNSGIKIKVKKLVVDSNDDAWILQSDGNTNIFYNIQTKKTFQFTPNIDYSASITKIYGSRNGLWILDSELDIFFIDFTGKIQIIINKPDNLQKHLPHVNQLNHIFQEDLNGDFWFSYPEYDGIYTWNSEKEVVEREIGLPQDELYVFMWEDQQGRTIFATSRNYRFVNNYFLKDENGEIIKWNQLLEYSRFPIQISSKDFFEYIFLATFTELQIIKFPPPFLKLYNTMKLTQKYGDFGNIVYGAIEVKNGNIYVYEEGQRFKYSKNGLVEKELPMFMENYQNTITKYHPLNDKIYTIIRKAVISQNKIIEFDPKTDTFRQLKMNYFPVRFVISNSNKIIFLAKDNNRQYSVVEYNLKDNSTTEICTIDKSLLRKNDTYSQIFFDEEKKNIWIAFRRSGLFIVDLKKRELFPQEIKLDLKESINFYGNLNKGSKDEMFLSTNNGLYVINTNNYDIKLHIDKEEGLKSNFICGAIEIDSNIWLPTGYGLYTYNRKTKNVISLFQNSGLPLNAFNIWTESVSQSGKMFFGNENGAVEIDSKKFKINNSSFIIYLRKISIKNNQGSDDYFSTFDNTIDIEGEKYQNIEFSLSHSDWKDNKDVRYISYIKGFDYKWKEPVSENIIKYRDLPAGKHKVLIKAISKTGVHSKNTLVINLKVTFPFYTKDWFKGFLTALIVGLIVFLAIKKYYDWINEKRNLKINYEKRISQLELMALQSQMNPHFIFNAINAIQDYLWKNDKEAVESYLNDFSKLMRLYLESSKSKTITLESELLMLKLYTRLEKLRFKDKFEVIFNIDKNIEPKYFKMPTMLVQPFVENAINHGIYHKITNGKVIITVNEMNEDLQFIIEDDGIGRKKAKEIKERSIHNYKSRALQITEERIDVLKEFEEIEIIIDVEDLKNKKGEARGTRVSIIIPEIY